MKGEQGHRLHNNVRVPKIIIIIIKGCEGISEEKSSDEYERKHEVTMGGTLERT